MLQSSAMLVYGAVHGPCEQGMGDMNAHARMLNVQQFTGQQSSKAAPPLLHTMIADIECGFMSTQSTPVLALT